jgi:hypothetical protein
MGIVRVLAALTLIGLQVGCGPLVWPSPECDPTAVEAFEPISCEHAVTAAAGALPADHARITRVQFLSGSARPLTCCPARAGEPTPPPAYVVFT